MRRVWMEETEQLGGACDEDGRLGHPLTYLAKKDFCSWGFLAFWACSISRRSMKAAVSGLG